MVLNSDITLQKKELIKTGEHTFLIEDINAVRPEGQEYSYLHFSLREKTSGELYTNLLSVPLPSKNQFFETSKFSNVMEKLGIVKGINEKITYEDLNSLIGKEVRGLVISDENNFMKIAENSLSVIIQQNL